MTQLPLDLNPVPVIDYPLSVIDHLAQAGRQRVLDGVVDAWGKHNPDGPRKQLGAGQRRAYEEYITKTSRSGPDSAETPVTVR